MDYQKANDYCHAAWFGAGSPPGVDVEDLIQEYLLAELEGLQPDKRVAEFLLHNIKQCSVTENGQRMTFVLADDGREQGESDEEHDEYMQLENEIHEEHQAERKEQLYATIQKLAKTHADYARALTILATTDALVPDEAIAEQMGITQRQAKHLRLHGMELLYGIAHPKSVKLPMFDLEDQVSELTKVYVRKPRYVQWMTDAILGAM